MASVAGEGGGKDMERPEGFHVSPRGERGIFQGTLKLGELFRNLNPFLKPWRLLAPVGCCCSQAEYREMGTGSQGSRGTDGMGWKGLNNAEPCRCAAAAENRLPSNPALNRF